MSTNDRILSILRGDELLQRLAAAEHERWAHWQQYVHDQGERQDDGSLVLPADLVSQWDTQIATPYCDLSPVEQQSDQEQVGRYLPLLLDALIE